MLYLSPGLTAYLLALTALLGLVMGSFLNCFAWRLAHGQSVTNGRSHCALCNHTLRLGDLVPVLSYLVLKGRCRYCGAQISPRYPAAEFISMVMFLSLVLRYDITFLTLRFLVLACLLLAAALVDLEVQRISDRLLAAAIVWYLVTLPLLNTDLLPALWAGAKGGTLVALPLLGFVLIADKVMGRESMGGGDIKLFFTVGLYLGLPLNLLNLILSCIVGVIFGIISQKARSGRDDPRAIPFGPAIAVGSWLTLLFGDAALNWYLGLFF